MAGPGNTDRTKTKRMIEYYRNHHRKAMNDNKENIADWGWVDLNSLLDFLRSLNGKADGVRFYFAAHDQDIEQRQKHYQGYNTVILVGTKNDNNGNNVDLKENNFTEATNYALSPGRNYRNGVNDDYDKTHIHPPEDDDNGDTILQGVIHDMEKPQKQTT